MNLNPNPELDLPFRPVAQPLEISPVPKRISADVPAAEATTATGAPVSHAAGGNASVAQQNPAKSRVVATVTRNSVVAITVAIGVSIANTPAATATPFHRIKRNHTG